MVTLISRGISRKGSNVSETALQFKHLTEKDKLVYYNNYQQFSISQIKDSNWTAHTNQENNSIRITYL